MLFRRIKISKKERKELKSKRKLYWKALKKCRKELVVAGKNYCPWDFGYLFDFMLIIFKHWEEYYKLGYNTDGEERKDSGVPGTENIPTREEIARTLYKKLDVVDDVADYDDVRERMKDFADYFAEWVRYMWD